MAEQELKWWHVRWRLAARIISRPAILFGKIIAVLSLVVAIGYGVIYLITPWLASQQMGKSDPRLIMVPAALPSMTEAPLSKAAIDCYGFRVPLPNEEITRTRRSDQVTVAIFRKGGILMIDNTSQDWTIFRYAGKDKYSKRLAGQAVFPSKFKLMQAVMWATPQQAKWWKFRTLENERIQYLLLLKSFVFTEPISLHSSKLGPIYSISLGGFRGFQIGNPDVPPYDTHLDLFDRADRYLAFDVTGPSGHRQVLTQAEINAIVASIRPASNH